MNPAPSASASVVAVLAIPTIKSAISSSVDLIIVCSPSTIRSPLIRTTPVLTPTPSGSRIRNCGPAIVAVFPVPARTETPIPVVSNLVCPA